MTDEEVASKGTRAALAMEEFIGPALEAVHAEYLERLTSVAASEPWASDKVVKLSVAVNVVRMVEAHLKAAIISGEHARTQINRAAEIERLPHAQRRWLNY